MSRPGDRVAPLDGCREGHLHLHLSDSRTGPRKVWFSSPARRILDGLPRDPPWVFASTRTKGHISSNTVGKLWTSIRAEAGLSDVRLHELRRTASHVRQSCRHAEHIPAGCVTPARTCAADHDNAMHTRATGKRQANRPPTLPEMQSLRSGKDAARSITSSGSWLCTTSVAIVQHLLTLRHTYL